MAERAEKRYAVRGGKSDNVEREVIVRNGRCGEQRGNRKKRYEEEVGGVQSSS